MQVMLHLAEGLCGVKDLEEYHKQAAAIGSETTSPERPSLASSSAKREEFKRLASSFASISSNSFKTRPRSKSMEVYRERNPSSTVTDQDVAGRSSILQNAS